MTTLHTLASGSSGNAALISRDGTHILLDAGISCRRITVALKELGLTAEDLSAVFITHTHSDHISGLQTLVKKYDVPIFASRRSCGGLAGRVAGIDARLRPFEAGELLSVGAFSVTPFSNSHDAPGATGYRFGDVGVLTDSGYVTEEAAAVLTGVPLLMLEANHDLETLRSGPYPDYLKDRVAGARGHLSNDDAAAFARVSALAGTREIVLAHLSRENNTPAMAYSTVERALAPLNTAVRLSVAPRDRISECYRTEGVPCRI